MTTTTTTLDIVNAVATAVLTAKEIAHPANLAARFIEFPTFDETTEDLIAAAGTVNDMLAGEYDGIVIDGDEAYAYCHYEVDPNAWVEVDLRTGVITDRN